MFNLAVHSKIQLFLYMLQFEIEQAGTQACDTENCTYFWYIPSLFFRSVVIGNEKKILMLKLCCVMFITVLDPLQGDIPSLAIQLDSNKRDKSSRDILSMAVS